MLDRKEAGKDRPWVVGMAVLGCLVAAVAFVAVTMRAQSESAPSDKVPVTPALVTGPLTFQRRTRPARTVVLDGRGSEVATLTDSARTVRLRGPARTFADPDFTKRRVITDAWVRLLPEPWTADAVAEPWFESWLTTALADTSPDMFAIAMEYLRGAEEKTDADGVRFAGDASFGPLSFTDPDGREERSDFFDYLGVRWTFPDAAHVPPQRDRYGAVDCSGFVRLVYGYRMGYPLTLGNEPGRALPRRAYAMAAVGPGELIIPNEGKPSQQLDRLQPGDLVFFDTEGSSKRTDHSGIYMGLDDAGHHRFMSSRSKADGPTFGDVGGDALLDGGGYWSSRFRAARRI
jgi:cell wall-associated NlpC family hydrolase